MSKKPEKKSILDQLDEAITGETPEEQFTQVVNTIWGNPELMAEIMQGVCVDLLNAVLQYRKENNSRNVKNIIVPDKKLLVPKDK